MKIGSGAATVRERLPGERPFSRKAPPCASERSSGGCQKNDEFVRMLTNWRSVGGWNQVVRGTILWESEKIRAAGAGQEYVRAALGWTGGPRGYPGLSYFTFISTNVRSSYWAASWIQFFGSPDLRSDERRVGKEC